MSKVLYCGPFDTYGVYKGGISVVVNDAFPELLNQAKNHEFIAFNTCLIKRDKTKQGRLNLENIKNTFLLRKELIKQIKNNNIDCVYYNTSAGIPLLKDLIVLNNIKKKCKVKVIVHIHFAEYKKIVSDKLSYLFLNLLKKMDGVVFLSNNTMLEFIEAGLCREKCFYLCNFHNISLDDPLIEKAKTPNNEKLNLIFIGAISERKGVLDLLNALKSIKRPFLLNICGEYIDEEIKKKVINTIADLPKDSVVFNGYVQGEEKLNILINSDILVLPSYGEGLPIVILEGMAAGCAIFATDVGANKEIVSEHCGVIFKAGDIETLTYRIENISEAELIKMKDCSFEISKQYSVQSFAENLISIINGVLI